MAGLHLTRRGQLQAEAIAGHLEGSLIQRVFSNPRERAMETARPLADRIEVAVEPCVALGEFD